MVSSKAMNSRSKFSLPGNVLVGNTLEYCQLGGVLMQKRLRETYGTDNREEVVGKPRSTPSRKHDLSPTHWKPEPFTPLPPDSSSIPLAPLTAKNISEYKEARMFLEGKVDAYTYMLEKIHEDSERVFRILSAHRVPRSTIDQIFEIYGCPIPLLPSDV